MKYDLSKFDTKTKTGFIDMLVNTKSESSSYVMKNDRLVKQYLHLSLLGGKNPKGYDVNIVVNKNALIDTKDANEHSYHYIHVVVTDNSDNFSYEISDRAYMSPDTKKFEKTLVNLIKKYKPTKVTYFS
jgi:hypothetical protein